jgi:DNA primase
MSLPPGFLDEVRARVPLSTVVGRAVIWDMRRSNRGKGDWWAPCPFHHEKTASFHVDDRKGFYYCFGCHAKGDALTFVKETQNVGFMEAVETLAREAGLAMPERDPAAAQKADRRQTLIAAVEEAAKVYRLQLAASAGAEARAYLARRGLSPEAQARWGIGWAPDRRNLLAEALGARGIPPETLEAAGLVARAEDGSRYDRFRGRIIFPVRDGRGRAVTLAGRSLDPQARAKYLNGPETEIFDKGRTLYNLDRAREAVGKGAPLILAEGYMDVIALAEAGFGGAVAPMGTAVTETQMALAWRVAPEPLVALDGDKAGLRAAYRLIDLALPLLEGGQGLRFAMLPGGQDPDEVIRSQGAAAMQAVLAAALPMVRLLWRRETEGQVLDSPERKAALRRRLREAIGRLRDPDLRRYYAEAFRHFEATELRPEGWLPEMRRRGGKVGPAPVRPEAKASLLARGETARAVEFMRETAIVAVALTNPDCVAAFETVLETLDLRDRELAAILQAVLANAHEDAATVRAQAWANAGREAVETLLGHAHIRVLPPVKAPDETMAADTLAEQLAKLSAERALRQEIGEAEDDMDGLADEGLTWRLAQAAAAVARAERGTVPMPEAGEDEASLSASLQRMIDAEIWKKPNR